MAHLRDLKPDPTNARKHTKRNEAMLRDSLQHNGAGRSILIDETNTILAGNATWEAAGAIGLEDVRIVEADGSTLIAVRRSDLTKQQKAHMKLADNRTAELAEWDGPMLLQDPDLDLADFFTPAELLLDVGDLQEPEEEEPPLAYRSITIRFPDQEAVEAFLALIGQQLEPGQTWCWYPPQEADHGQK